MPDLHGSVAAAVGSTFATTSDAFRYDAYGNLAASVTSSLPTPWRYQGRLLVDPAGATDLYDAGARFYSPGLGSFTQLDSYGGSAQDPASMNRYLYAEANPATLVDPDGHRVMIDYGTQAKTASSSRSVNWTKVYAQRKREATKLAAERRTLAAQARSAAAAAAARRASAVGAGSADADYDPAVAQAEFAAHQAAFAHDSGWEADTPEAKAIAAKVSAEVAATIVVPKISRPTCGDWDFLCKANNFAGEVGDNGRSAIKTAADAGGAVVNWASQDPVGAAWLGVTIVAFAAVCIEACAGLVALGALSTLPAAAPSLIALTPAAADLVAALYFGPLNPTTTLPDPKTGDADHPRSYTETGPGGTLNWKPNTPSWIPQYLRAAPEGGPRVTNTRYLP